MLKYDAACSAVAIAASNHPSFKSFSLRNTGPLKNVLRMKTMQNDLKYMFFLYRSSRRFRIPDPPWHFWTGGWANFFIPFFKAVGGDIPLYLIYFLGLSYSMQTWADLVWIFKVKVSREIAQFPPAGLKPMSQATGALTNSPVSVCPSP